MKRCSWREEEKDRKRERRDKDEGGGKKLDKETEYYMLWNMRQMLEGGVG